MSHMVIYRSLDGQPVFHPVDSLEDAARHVESLRNAGQADDARIFAMKEVKIEVRTYYRVEVATDEAPSATEVPAPAAPAAPAPAPAKPPVAADTSATPAPPAAATPPTAVKPEPAVAGAAGGRFGLFGKG